MDQLVNNGNVLTPKRIRWLWILGGVLFLVPGLAFGLIIGVNIAAPLAYELGGRLAGQMGARIGGWVATVLVSALSAVVFFLGGARAGDFIGQRLSALAKKT